MAPAAAFAQTAEQAGAIRSILVEGNQRIEARTIQSYLLFSPGDPFDSGKIDLSLKTLFATGLFSDIAIDRSGDDVVVRVVENPMVNRVIFEGNKALKEDKLKEEIQLAPRSSLTSARVMQDVNRMMEMYRRAGRFSAKITPQYKPLPQNRVDVIFVIEEGPTTGVRSVSFLGNNVFSDARLRSEIVTKQSRLWNFFSSNDNYDSSRLEYDREVLRKLYQDNGYYDFRVISAVAEMTPDEKDFFITFSIEEGEQYSFGDIKVETSLSKLDAGMLTNLTPVHSGQLYRGQAIEQTIDALTYAAGVAGYAFVDIRPIVVADPETRKIDITFVVDEGPRVYINRINIIGNTATLDRVIRREMRVSEGNAFNRVLIDRSRNRIRALGFFKDVTIEETPTADGERTDINVKVEEQSTGELAFSAGYSSSENLQFDVSMTQANLLGTGRSASLRLATSSLQQTATLNFTEPRFLDRSLSAGIQSWLTRSDYTDYSSYEAVSYGIGASMGFPLTDRTQLGLRYRLQYDNVDYADRNIIIDRDGNLVASSVRDADGVARAPQASDITSNDQLLVDVCDVRYLFRDSTCSSEADALSSVVGYYLNWDGRNDPIEPTRGMEFQFSQEVAGLGGDVQTFKSEASAATYYGLTKSLRASLRLSAGFIEPWGDDNTVRINNRFFRGGSSFRGFDVAGLGPRQVVRMYDPDTGEEVSLTRGSALGGNAYYQATAELTVPNFLPEEYGIKSALFIDAGGLGSLYDQDVTDPVEYTDSSTGYDAIQYTETDPSLRASAGISFMWDSPFGPLRFDFAHILKSEDYDRTQSFRFSTSTRF
ncbi:MAG: outer membrane protein assembly factor BamA [Hyphomonas sp.]|nr:outer membrane protein assembly factor BamA [Hyphomonas sp.]